MSDPGASRPVAAPGRAGVIILVALLVAALCGAIFVYRERTPDLALEVVSLEREITRGEDRGAFTFFVRFDEPDATVSIVGRNGREVRTLVSGYALEAGERIRCLWDGRGDGGSLSRTGSYRLRVQLPSEDRDMVYPRRIEIVSGGEIDDPGPGSRPDVIVPPCAPEAG